MKKHGINRMFRFIKHIFFTLMKFFSCTSLNCVSMNNQECNTRPETINSNNETLFYPYSILANNCVVVVII